MRLLPRDPYRLTIVFAFLALFLLTCINPPYFGDFVLQHVLTVAALTVLTVCDRKLKLSRLSFTLSVAFLALHLVGARYLYSGVPYDDWARSLFGVSISERFGFTRNHYDRLVHFAYGILLVIPVREVLVRHLRLRPLWGTILAVDVILSTSALYELAEWGVALSLAPEAAEAYNGQQGDMWDAHKDMTLAMFGAVLSMTVTAVASASRAKSQANNTETR